MTSTELDYARQLAGSAIVAEPHCLDVITLACAATHKIDDLFTALRLLALGEKGSGKSTVLTVASYLSANPEPVTGVLAMTAPSYVADFRMNSKATHFLDEIHHLFGLAGQNGKSSKFYTYLNQGYRRDTAFAQFQENKVPLRIPIFGIVFMAGLGLAVPPDMRDRSIVIRMVKARDGQQVADFSSEDTRAAFTYGGRMLKSWAQRTGTLDIAAVRGMHPKLVHRTLDVWGPLFRIALEAGDEWTARIMTAFERIELGQGVPVYAPEDQILVDYLNYTVDVAKPEATGIASGAFAKFANDQQHGAYLHMKPGQFRQFAVGILGPTVPFYDSDLGTMVRGWSDVVHQLNIRQAQAKLANLTAARDDDTAETETWEDF
ncbi:MAG TPA: DUF3631 domain-containing protein, partial [Candidatus Sulfotelmatobacter sp.]|jgi:hypothetical protein|nr:DUF3631 domain-containing protein [Candidatus Sulfotelmatobacter sp.]